MTFTPTRGDLARLFARPSSVAKARIYDDYVNTLTSPDGLSLLDRYGITTAKRWNALVATWAPETGNFTVLRESGSYTASRILQVFGAGRHSAGVTPSEARKLAGNGPALFERVYGLGNPRKAKELGNHQKGDGWKFRGWSYNQITGRWAFENKAKKIGCSVDEMIASPVHGLHAALIEWDEKGCNGYADRGDIVSIRKLINAGSLKVSTSRLNGLPEMRAAYADATKLWRDDGVVVVADPLVCKLGDRGPRVRELQERLTSAGFPCGPIDGHFGKLTERALAAFQVAHGLTGTGSTDASVWATLEAEKPVVVVRENVTEGGLAQLGSRIVRVGQRIRRFGKMLWVTCFGVVGADASGLDVLDQAGSAADRVNSFVGRVIAPNASVNPKVWVVLALAVIGIVGLFLSRWGNQTVAARVEDARTGANVGK